MLQVWRKQHAALLLLRRLQVRWQAVAVLLLQ
jgi:hypothetical protein